MTKKEMAGVIKMVDAPLVKRHEIVNVFKTLAEAKEQSQKLEATYGKKRWVYKYTSPAGETIYIVAQNLGRARSHAAAHIKLPVFLAEKGQHISQTPEQIVQNLTPEDRAKLVNLLQSRK